MNNVRGQGALPTVNAPGSPANCAGFDYDLLVTLAALDIEVAKHASAAGLAAELLFPMFDCIQPPSQPEPEPAE